MRCAGSAPELMRRRMVRVEVLKISAVSSIVRRLVRDRLRKPVPVTSVDLFEAGRCAGLTVRWAMSRLLIRPVHVWRDLGQGRTPPSPERRRNTQRPGRLYPRSSIHRCIALGVRHGRGSDTATGTMPVGAVLIASQWSTPNGDRRVGDGLSGARTNRWGEVLCHCVEGRQRPSPFGCGHLSANSLCSALHQQRLASEFRPLA